MSSGLFRLALHESRNRRDTQANVSVGSFSTDPSSSQRRPMSAVAPTAYKPLHRSEMSQRAITGREQSQQSGPVYLLARTTNPHATRLFSTARSEISLQSVIKVRNC